MQGTRLLDQRITQTGDERLIHILKLESRLQMLGLQRQE
jgi:hypothetical protein